jgi:hypothetical protein
LRLRWTDHALADLEELSERAPGQAGTVYDAVNWLARQRFPNLGRDVPELDCRYWPVPPQGGLLRGRRRGATGAPDLGRTPTNYAAAREYSLIKPPSLARRTIGNPAFRLTRFEAIDVKTDVKLGVRLT